MQDGEDGRIDWSYSNARLYESCPRALYYRQRNHTSSDDVEAATTSNWTPIGSAIGVAIHYGIATQIDEWAQNQPLSLQSAQSAAVVRLESIYTSEGNRVIEEEVLASATSTVRAHLQRFFRVIWPRFENHRYITHEQTSSFEIEGQTVWVKADLCTRGPEGNFVVTDWKSRSPDIFENRTLQLTLYALWATETFEPDRERIRVQQVFTSNGEFVRRTVSDPQLAGLRSRIVTESQAWNTEFAKSEFPARPSREKCSECLYRSNCGPGQDILRG